MKTKLIPCPNITKRELMTALMDGRKFALETELEFIHLGQNRIHWDDNFGNTPVRIGIKPWNWRGIKYLHEEIEQKWWDDPDMVGKPVKVRDHVDADWECDKFEEYVSCDISSFKCSGDSYTYAEPLTPADLYQGGEA